MSQCARLSDLAGSSMLCTCLILARRVHCWPEDIPKLVRDGFRSTYALGKLNLVCHKRFRSSFPKTSLCVHDKPFVSAGISCHALRDSGLMWLERSPLIRCRVNGVWFVRELLIHLSPLHHQEMGLSLLLSNKTVRFNLKHWIAFRWSFSLTLLFQTVRKCVVVMIILPW